MTRSYITRWFAPERRFGTSGPDDNRVDNAMCRVATLNRETVIGRAGLPDYKNASRYCQHCRRKVSLKRARVCRQHGHRVIVRLP